MVFSKPPSSLTRVRMQHRSSPTWVQSVRRTRVELPHMPCSPSRQPGHRHTPTYDRRSSWCLISTEGSRGNQCRASKCCQSPGGAASLFIAQALCASVPQVTMTTAFRQVCPKPTDSSMPPDHATAALYHSTPVAFAFAAPENRRSRAHCVSRCPRLHREVNVISCRGTKASLV
jgi:hypothetical protein